jgi:hypothetical protein
MLLKTLYASAMSARPSGQPADIELDQCEKKFTISPNATRPQGFRCSRFSEQVCMQGDVAF